MKRIKKVFSVMVALTMMLSMTSITAFANEKNSTIQIVEQGEKIYYLASGEVAGSDQYDVWTSKNIAGTENEDEFEITLQVGTTVKPVPNDIAVVLVMDASGSMMKDSSGYIWGRDGVLPTDGRKLRIDYAREAAMEFAEKLAENTDGAERMLSVVEFGNNAMTVLPWTNVNENGELNEEVEEAISSVEVNFSHERSFWDEERMETFELTPDKGVTLKQAKVKNWSDEFYTHEMKNFFEVKFESREQTFITEDDTVQASEISGGVK